jgi:hypothetical protein
MQGLSTAFSRNWRVSGRSSWDSVSHRQRPLARLFRKIVTKSGVLIRAISAQNPSYCWSRLHIGFGDGLQRRKAVAQLVATADVPPANH